MSDASQTSPLEDDSRPVPLPESSDAVATSEPTTDASPTLDAVLDQLDETEALVTRARDSLEETLSGLKLTPEEEKALEGELAQLATLVADAIVQFHLKTMLRLGRMPLAAPSA